MRWFAKCKPLIFLFVFIYNFTIKPVKFHKNKFDNIAKIV